MTAVVNFDFGSAARNRIDDTRDPGEAGSVAALETFYYALNNADLQVLSTIWSDDAAAQLNNPVGGILRSGRAITDLYRVIFGSGIGIQVTFTDAAAFVTPGAAVFAGREIGTYLDSAGQRTELRIRTTRMFTWATDAGRWRQMHHHGSIDDPAMLASYQAAAKR